ncbi:MAG: hypothetical protein RBT15_06875 [Gudongella sp.]|jgi:predicted ATP-grasp superfamily ATP-dependent carboligase|nr:hypothetical protein [Gudongella sp.]
MRDMPNKIIVLGGQHHNDLGLIRSLGEEGCLVYFISINSERSFVTKSKYIIKYWETQKEDAINIILNEFDGESNLPILLPSDDLSAHLLDCNYDKLKDNFIFPHIRSTDLTMSSLMNKEILNKLAIKYGFNVPISKVVELSLNDTDISRIIMNDIGMPCIVKPVQSLEGDKSDILIIENPQQLIQMLSLYRKKYIRLFVQQYINKIGEVGIQGLSMYNSREVKIAGVVNKIRVSNRAPGSTTYGMLDFNFDSEIENQIISLIKGIQFCGIFDIEIMYDKDRKYFIEMNFRNGAYGYAFTKAGANLPYFWCKEAVGINDYSTIKIEKTKKIMNEFADFRNVLDKNVKLFKWIYEFTNADVHLILNYLDLKPFLYKLGFTKF